MTIQCSGTSSEYFLGEGRREERLGDVPYRVQWRRSTSPIKVPTSEYMFARCGFSVKEAVLTNRFNRTVAIRANSTAQNILRSLSPVFNLTSQLRPLSVYLLVFDSVSRLHFYRNFPHTVKYLNQEGTKQGNGQYSVFDFLINNAEGENTAPNMISMLYGMKLDHLKRAVLKGLSHQRSDQTKELLETQKYAMWKEMERRGFVTLFGFDTIWDYLSHYTGRVIDTDHMISNFYHAARRVFGYNEFSLKQRCLGCFNAHSYPLNYITEFHQNYREYNRFGYIHISTGHEHTGTVIQTADDDLLHLLQRLFTETSPDEDIAVMIASDHGLHVGAWDRAYEGFIENQLPLHLLITNNALLERLGPNTEKTLRHNTQRLVSRWDWHLTFQHLSTVPYGRLLPDSDLYETWKRKSETPHAVSLLLEEIPDSRTCADVHIPLHYCSCLSFSELPTAPVFSPVPELVSLALHSIRLEIKQTKAEFLCPFPTLNEISKILEQQIDSNSTNYKIRFTTNESSKAKFDLIGFQSTKANFASSHIPENDPFHPVRTLETGLKLQLLEVVRADEYAGPCEHLAKAFHTKPSLCLCQFPFSDASLSTPAFTQTLETLLEPLTFIVPNRAVPCSTACTVIGKGCSEWALPILNDKRVLLETWRAQPTRKIRLLKENKEVTIAELNIQEWRREGAGLKLREMPGNTWDVLLGDWGKDTTCADKSGPTRQFCACY